MNRPMNEFMLDNVNNCQSLRKRPGQITPRTFSSPSAPNICTDHTDSRNPEIRVLLVILWHREKPVLIRYIRFAHSSGSINLSRPFASLITRARSTHKCCLFFCILRLPDPFRHCRIHRSCVREAPSVYMHPRDTSV